MSDYNYSGPIEVDSGIFWVGFADDNAGLHCNPYLIVEEDEAILIDGGSRDDFSTVMMKLLQTGGTDPNHIERLIYQHYDPDLCGSIPHFENLIKNNRLKIISHRENNIFIKYYSSRRPKQCIEDIDMAYTFKSGRKLEFIRTPYAHSPGSFMTFDTKTRTLFSSDVFGSYDRIWDLFLELEDRCNGCRVTSTCPHTEVPCPVKGIIDFHKRIMTSSTALGYALSMVEKINPDVIAPPQHGSVIVGPKSINSIIGHLRQIENVGIDWYLEGGVSYED